MGSQQRWLDCLILAGTFPGPVRGLILEAPHVLVEGSWGRQHGECEDDLMRLPICPDARDAIMSTGIEHPGENKIWLDPAFRDWNIASSPPLIRGPILGIQGEEDEYRTEQVKATQAHVARTEVLMLSNPDTGPIPTRQRGR